MPMMHTQEELVLRREPVSPGILADVEGRSARR